MHDRGRDRGARRLARLKEELLDEMGLDLDESALLELDYAMRPPVHEGRMPSYGAVVARPGADGQQILPLGRETGQVLVEPHKLDRPTMRMLADGYSAFVWADENDSLLVVHPFAPDPVSVARFAAETGTIVVRRSMAGVVTVTVSEGVATFDGNWRIRPSAAAYVRPYRTLFQPSLSFERVLRSVLQLCLDVLSPASVGATIVWTPAVDLVKESHFDERPAISLPALDVTEQHSHGALLSLFGQLDRAAVLDASGRLSKVGVGLTAPSSGGDRSTGTRHGSARDYSRLHPGASVFVVSSDGPVSVFKDGTRIVNDEFVVDVRTDKCMRCSGRGFILGPTADDREAVSECQSCGGAGLLVSPEPDGKDLTHAEAEVKYAAIDRRRARSSSGSFARFLRLNAEREPPILAEQLTLPGLHDL